MRRFDRYLFLILGVALCVSLAPLSAYGDVFESSPTSVNESKADSVNSESATSDAVVASSDTTGERESSSSPEAEQSGDAEHELTPAELAIQHQGDLPDGLYTFHSKVNDAFVLDCPGGKADAGKKPQLYKANSTDAQVWVVSHDANGFVVIKSLKGTMLDLSDAKAANGSAIQLWNDNSTMAQRWVAVKNDDGSLTFYSAIDTTFAIDVYGGRAQNGSSIQLYTSNCTAAQCWNLVPAKTEQQQLDERALAHKDDLSDGSYAMLTSDGSYAVLPSTSRLQLGTYSYSLGARFAVSTDVDGYRVLSILDDRGNDTGFVLDVFGGSSANGTIVQAYKANGTKAQKWIIEKVGSSYRLISALDGSKALDVPGDNIRQGSGLQLFSANGTAAQIYNFIDPADARQQLDKLANDNISSVPDGEYAIVGGIAESRMVLDVVDGSHSDGGNVQIFKSNGTNAQRWRISHDKLGYLTITNVNSGKVLDVSGGFTANATNVQQFGAGGTSNWAQKWIAVANSDGSVTLVSAVWPNRVLDIAGGKLESTTNVQLFTKNNTAAQRFTFISSAVSKVEPCDDVLDSDGWFTIAPTMNDSLVFDVAAGSASDGGNLQLYSRNQTLSQLFKPEYVNGYYVLRNAGSGKVLDVDSGDIVPGTNVQQWSEYDNGNQLFRAEVAKDGSVTFINKATGLTLAVASSSGSGSNLVVSNKSDGLYTSFLIRRQDDLLTQGIYEIASASQSGLALDVAGASARSGANVQIYSSNGTFAQKWLLSKVEGRENTYTLESVSSANRLAVSGNNVCVTSPSASSSQMWIASIDKNGIEFVSVANPTMSLDIAGGNLNSGSNVQVYKSNSTKAQRFRLHSTSAFVNNGTYFIRLTKNYNRVLDVTGGSGSDGANVQVWHNNDSGAQKWNFSRNGDGSYTIVNAASNKALDLKDCAAFNGSNIQQWSQNGSGAQHWFIDYVNGGFRISSAVDRSFVIDAAGGSASNGTNIAIWQDNGTSAQRFTIQGTTYVPPLPADQQAMLNRAQWYNSNTGWLILTDTVGCRTGIFTGCRGNWKLYSFWQCAPGKNSTPTVLGEYTVYGKGISFGHGYTCWYYTQFYGDYLFHSQPCYSGTFNVKNPEMGQRASAGCIRLTLDHAKWIYDNIPYGTKVVNY